MAGMWSHTRELSIIEENRLDPDDGKSMLCAACRLPIFSTRYVTIGSGEVLMHDKCAPAAAAINDDDDAHIFPAKLKAHQLHSGGDLILHHQEQQHSTTKIFKCSRCYSICGTSFYKCPDDRLCGFQLDLACALPMNRWVLHRSHPHRLTVIKAKSLLSSAFTCGVCVTQHRRHEPPAAAAAKEWKVYYVCVPCDFWVHPDCAHLPTAIQLDGDHHPHPLLLKYLNPDDDYENYCAICRKWCRMYKSESLGVYECFHCDYSLHIKCALYNDHLSFKHVKIRDAQVPGLLHLPMPNETTSVMAHILLTTKAADDGGTSTSHQMISDDGGKLSLFKNKKIHEHPLILHDDDPAALAAAAATVARICNACVELISPSDPFYSCCTTTTTTLNNNNNKNNNNNELDDGCRDFFLHTCCAQYLPTQITANHRSHALCRGNQSLTLVSKPAGRGPFNMFDCDGCGRFCNGFAYVCEECDDYYLDIVCAFMKTSITHAVHATSHILLPTSYPESIMCICCAQRIDPWLKNCYKCYSCRNVGLHARCALLPDTVAHKFDTHPLKLISTDDGDHQRVLVRGEQMFCEICEDDIVDNTKTWYYGCNECDNYFHTGCIPSVDRLSKIKFGFTIRVACHASCPLTCVRALSVEGYRCGCGTCDREIIEGSDELAFECFECYFRIRKKCAVGEIL